MGILVHVSRYLRILQLGTFHSCASQYDFATISTDTGHSSHGGDASWGLNSPESLYDWGYRALHGSVVLAKVRTDQSERLDFR